MAANVGDQPVNVNDRQRNTRLPPIRHNVVANRHLNTMGYFSSGGKLTRPVGDAISAIMPLDDGAVVEVHTNGPGENTYSLIRTLTVAMSKEDESYQLSAYVCSLICCFIPEILPLIDAEFAELGVRVVEVNTDEARKNSGLVLQNPLPGPAALVYFGQAVLLFYKNVQSASYVNFMTKRITALASVAGLPNTGANRVTIMLGLDKAEGVSRVLGSCFALRKRLMEAILHTAVGTSRMASFCTYLAGILEYTGMAALSFIYETLILTRSPVMRVAQLRQERRNLRQAFEAVNGKDYPKYFKIMNPPSETRVVESSNFPTFFALAKQIKAGQSTTANPFASSRSTEDKFVSSLLLMHQEYLDSMNPTVQEDADYLFNMDPGNTTDPAATIHET